MIALLLGIIVGLVAGLLVYRNNVARAKDIELKATAEIEAGKAKGKSILNALKGK